MHDDGPQQQLPAARPGQQRRAIKKELIAAAQESLFATPLAAGSQDESGYLSFSLLDAIFGEQRQRRRSGHR